MTPSRWRSTVLALNAFGAGTWLSQARWHEGISLAERVAGLAVAFVLGAGCGRGLEEVVNPEMQEAIDAGRAEKERKREQERLEEAASRLREVERRNAAMLAGVAWSRDEFPAILTKLVAEGKYVFETDDEHCRNALVAAGLREVGRRWVEESPENLADGWGGYPAHTVWTLTWEDQRFLDAIRFKVTT